MLIGNFMDEFYAQWNQSGTGTNEALEGAAEEAGRMCAHAFNRQYVKDREENPILRLSSLGKSHAVELLAKKFGIIPTGGDRTVSPECRLRFVTGDLFEAQMYMLLSSFGFTIEQTQTDIDWHGVKGHSDFIVVTPSGERCLLELKTANDFYFKAVHKTIGDERGYLTQACCYSEALNLPLYWVFLNKDTSKIFIKPLVTVPADVRNRALNRAKMVVNAFEQCQRFEDFPLFVNVPPPKIEQYKDHSFKLDDDGNPLLYIPDYFINKPELFYEIRHGKTSYGKPRMYVTDFKGYDLYPERKPEILKYALRFAN
jgi:hypothetical protein